MPTYKNIDKEQEKTPEMAKGGIFKSLQQWINKRSFFNKEVNTNSDERVLTGYEYDPNKRREFLETSKSIAESVNTFYHNRTERYTEYESMERVAEVASALDLIADEAVQTGQNGHILKVESTNGRVVEELENLFFNILKIDNDAWDKVRGMCMYGDRFEEIVINRTDPGILYLNYIDPATIERVEARHRLMYFRKHEDRKTDENREYNSYMPTSGTSGNYGAFYQNGKRTDQTIQAFRIAHFKLEDARNRPYGRSSLESSRKTVRQLNLLEDSIVTYRYARASEKRVWNIDCGELGPDEAMAYVTQVKNNLRKKPKFNPRTGTLDFEYDPQSITEDFFIPIRTGMTNNSVTTLPGATNLGEINDLLYYKKKLFFALKIPLAFIGEEGLSYAKSNLALIDIRFARFIERIQRFFEKGLEKIAIIHLLLKKFSVDEIKNFKIRMTPASNIREKTILDEMNGKFGVMQAGKGLEIFPDAWLLTEIWGASEEETENIMKLMKMQKAGVEAGAPAGGVGGGLGGLGGELGAEELGPPPGEVPGEEGLEGLTPPPEAGAGLPPPEATGEEIPGGEAAGEPIAAESEEISDKEKLLIEANKKLLEKLGKLEGEKEEFKSVANNIINKNKALEEKVDAENNLKKALKKLFEQKKAKKMNEKKDNINNYLQEFKIFGELEGFKAYEQGLKQVLTEETKSRRKK